MKSLVADFVELALHELDGPDYTELTPISTPNCGVQRIRCAAVYADYCDEVLSTIAAGNEPLT